MGKIDSVAEDLGLIRERLAKGSWMISRGFGMGMSKGMGWLAVVLVISSPFDTVLGQKFRSPRADRPQHHTFANALFSDNSTKIA